MRRCSADLAALGPPIPYFGAKDYGVVSKIRAADGEVIGLAVEACGPGGEAVKRNGRTLRRFFNLADKRMSAGLFRAVVVDGCGRAVMTEGHLAKAIAAAAAYPDRSVYGWGSRAWLGLAVPPEDEILVLEDGSLPVTDAHRADMERGADRLILGGKRVTRAPGPGCPCGRARTRTRRWPGTAPRSCATGVEAIATVAELSLDGEARRCARIKDPLKRAQAIAD